MNDENYVFVIHLFFGKTKPQVLRTNFQPFTFDLHNFYCDTLLSLFLA